MLSSGVCRHRTRVVHRHIIRQDSHTHKNKNLKKRNMPLIHILRKQRQVWTHHPLPPPKKNTMKRKCDFRFVLSATVILSILYQIRFLLYIQYSSLPQISLVGLDINHCFINNTAYMENFQFYQL